jgi:hypothetical protein
MRSPKKRKNKWKNDDDGGTGAIIEGLFELAGPLWKGLCYVVNIIIVWFEHM